MKGFHYDARGLPVLEWPEERDAGGHLNYRIRSERRCYIEIDPDGRYFFCHEEKRDDTAKHTPWLGLAGGYLGVKVGGALLKAGGVGQSSYSDRRLWSDLQGFVLTNESEYFGRRTMSGDQLKKPDAVIVADFGNKTGQMVVAYLDCPPHVAALIHGRLTHEFYDERQSQLARLAKELRKQTRAPDMTGATPISSERTAALTLEPEQAAKRLHYFTNVVGRFSPEEREEHLIVNAPLEVRAESDDYELEFLETGNTEEMDVDSDLKKRSDFKNWDIRYEVKVPLPGIVEGTVCKQEVEWSYRTENEFDYFCVFAPPVRNVKGASDYGLKMGIWIGDLLGFEIRNAREWQDPRFAEFEWCDGEEVILALVEGAPAQLALRCGLSNRATIDAMLRIFNARLTLARALVLGEGVGSAPAQREKVI